MSIEEIKKLIADLEAKKSETTDKGELAKLEIQLQEAQKSLEEAEAAEQEGDDDDTNQSNDDDDDDIEARIERLAEEKLAKMKANMDKMAEKLAKSEKEKADLAKARKEEKMKKLEEEGKLQELAEMRVAEANAELDLLRQENTSLKRDQVVSSALATLEFKNDRSREMARRDIVDNLEQDDDGNWVSKDGKTIASFVEEYSKDTNNEFLFRSKPNTGGGKDNPGGKSDTSPKKGILEMTGDELLEMARKGKLGSFGY